MRALFQTWRLELRMVLSLLRQKKQWVPAGVDQLILRRFQTRSFDCDYFMCGVKCRVEITLLTALEDDVRANPTPFCVPCQIRSMQPTSPFDCFLGPHALQAPILFPPPPPPLDFASLYPKHCTHTRGAACSFCAGRREQVRKEKREKRAHYQHKKK